MIHITPPEGFAPKFEVVTCYVQRGGKFLVMLRNSDKDEGNKWGTPGGKVEQGETREAAMQREVVEETGLVIAPDDFKFFQTIYVRYPRYDFIFHEYSADVSDTAELALNTAEHQEARWVTPEEALTMPLVMGNDILVRMFYHL